MASKGKTRKADPVREAAADYFAARSHAAWRRRLLKTNPTQKDKPRMRLRGGVMVDVNQPWSKLHPKAKADNEIAARDAYQAVKRFPTDREAAAAYVHERWMARNKGDASQPKALFKPYGQLPKVEKDKDRAHVDSMKKALAAVRKSARVKAPSKAAKARSKRAARTTVHVDAKSWQRLESAAKDLSKALGRPVAPETLLNAGLEAMAAVTKAVAAQARAKKT
jgi:hypothetical protein